MIRIVKKNCESLPVDGILENRMGVLSSTMHMHVDGGRIIQWETVSLRSGKMTRRPNT